MTKRQKAVIAAVKRLYDSQPGVVRFTMTRGKDGVLRRGGYTWYRDAWMNEILNAYRLLRGKRV